MLRHYLRLFQRQLRRQMTYQMISILGLAVGIGTVIVIAACVRFESSYDKFQKDSDRLVRIYEIQSYPNGDLDVAVTPFPLAPALACEFPEVESTVRLWYGAGLVLSRGEVRVYESELIYADENFFEVFSYPLIRGVAAQVLSKKNSAVISRKMATKFFGDDDPVGQTLRVNGNSDLLVTGVMDEMPSNGHLHASMIISLPTASDNWTLEQKENWGTNGYSTYALLRRGINRQQFDARLENILKTFRNKESTTRLYAQNISDIHLGPVLVAENSNVADPKRLWVFGTAAILVLVIACINYINLATARAGLRYREFGVRSCLGAGLGQMRRQIIAEALAASFIASLLAVVLSELTFPLLREILSPVLPRESLRDGFVLLILLVTWAVTGIAAGVYPAMMISRNAPARMLRITTQKGGQMRRVLVVAQFAASVIFIVLTMVILRQQQFMKSTSIGAHIDQLLVIPLRGEEAQQHYQTFQDKLRGIEGVSKVSAIAELPNQIVWSSTFNWEGQIPGEEILFNTDVVDDEFAETFGVEVAEGRNFRKGEKEVCLLNETAVKQIGWSSGVGKSMFLGDSTRATVVGVVKDFHFTSLRDKIAPLVLYPQSNNYSNLIARVNSDNISKTMKQIEEAAGEVLPNTPYRSYFFDQVFERIYDAEIRLQRSISFFAALAILLACLGLFGLAAFSIERRTKEVGIRKVLGAGVGSIVALHVKEYVLWLMVANVIACPAAFYLSNKWLAGFAYRTSLPWWLFAMTGAITLALALATVAIQTIRAASANPVRSLRYE